MTSLTGAYKAHNKEKLIMCNERKSIRIAAFVLVTIMAVITGRPAFAQQVNICQALTLYGNAATTGLCLNLSTNAHWVCELAAGNPDIHTTFNAGTPFHVTAVTSQPTACNQSSDLAGVWPGGLRIQDDQPNMICNVNVQNYVNRLNAVPQIAPGGANGNTHCMASFLAAQNAGRIPPAVGGFYLALCRAYDCQ
jgi:hypothetical protein